MLQKEGHILIVDDDTDVLFSARMLLKDHFMKVQTLHDPKQLIRVINTSGVQLVLLDMNYAGSDTSGREGIYWLRQIMALDNPPVVIMMTAFSSVNIAIQAMKEGASDFVVKPWQNDQLLATVSSGLASKRPRQEAQPLPVMQQAGGETDKQSVSFIGQSASMLELYKVIDRIAATDANILILGENGTGKELVARSIHRQSLRHRQPLVSVDIGAISETLFESELFGHVKGAFTDAKEDRVGRFEAASGGTLFLDEIGNFPVTLQAKVLTALQNREITRLGSNKKIPIDIRLIAATNMPVYDMVADGTFREDLLYRIKTIELYLPPLRERDGDIPLLAQHFLDLYCHKYRKPGKKLSAETLKKLETYIWPGNVRELQHAMERVVIMTDTRILKPEDFFFAGARQTRGPADSYKLNELEVTAIKKALEKHQGNISKTAAELGLSRAALYRKIEKYGIQ